MQENTRYKQYGNTKDWYTLQSFLMSFCSVAANDLCIIIKASVFIIARFIPENCQKKKKEKSKLPKSAICLHSIWVTFVDYSSSLIYCAVNQQYLHLCTWSYTDVKQKTDSLY